MDFSMVRLAFKVEAAMEENPPPCGIPFFTVNPILSPTLVSPWAASASALTSPPSVFPYGVSNGYGASAPLGGPSGDMEVLEMEHLFSKTLTQSDVGKLNRLLIPRREAERHFPTAVEPADGGNVPSFLTFEDSAGKVWHFRYCFWGSSRTFVLTRGWSYFVKAKGLAAGDTVSFYLGAGQGQAAGGGIARRFIHCRYRRVPAAVLPPPPFAPSDNWPLQGPGSRGVGGVGPAWQPACFASDKSAPGPDTMPGSSSQPQPQPAMVHEPTSLGHHRGKGVASAKRVRLFGVDHEIPPRPGSGEPCHGRAYGAA
ncbi:hypothetical protein ACP70R_022115 [Stipagrostis hirtigluma subsp. patula]